MASKLAQYIASAPIVVLGRAGCSYCAKAKQLIETSYADKYKYFDIGGQDDVFAEIKKQYDHETTPICFVSGKFVGGNSDLQAAHAAGKINV